MSGGNADQVKAFKVAFGIKPDSDNWAKIIAVMNQKLPVFLHTVELLEQVNSPLAGQARTEYTNLNQTAGIARAAFAQNRRTGGEMARDSVLAPLRTAMDHYRKASKNAPVSVDLNGTAVDVFWTDIPGFDDMAPNDRAAALQTVARKVQDGKALYNDLLAVPPVAIGRAATGKDVTDLVWAMKSAAQTQAGEAFEKGALTMPGGVALRNFLDTCPDVYRRASSHLEEQQALPGQSARGIDFYGGAATLGAGGDGLLPSGMNTLLYQKITTADGEERLYIKMETEGAPGTERLSKGRGDPTAPPSRASRDGDFKHAMKHTFNFLAPKTQSDKDLGAHREDADKEIKRLAKEMVKTVQDRGLKSRLAAAMGGKHLRVGTLVATIKDMLDSDELPEDPMGRGFEDAFNALDDALAEKYRDITTALGASGDEVNVTATQL